jgi:formamidopyrimidine-DNA glycosylase
MPELPDLEIFRKNLLKFVNAKTIAEVGGNAQKAIISGTMDDLRKITEGMEIIAVTRRGKHLIFTLSNNAKIVIHLMLRGRLSYFEQEQETAFEDCFWFVFGDKSELKITDKTHWVKLEILKGGDLNSSKLLAKLGPEADLISRNELIKILKSSRLGRIKPFLMDQSRISGIGNAYADEILWESRISPQKTASLLTEIQMNELYCAIKKVLEWGIQKNEQEVGDTFFESKREWMHVYRKKGKPCPRCTNPIKYIKVNQRDTFFCPVCQK